jgi:hypothetical protein
MSGSGNEEGTRTEQDQQVSSSEAGEANTQATQQPSSDPGSASGSENQGRRSMEWVLMMLYLFISYKNINVCLCGCVPGHVSMYVFV